MTRSLRPCCLNKFIPNFLISWSWVLLEYIKLILQFMSSQTIKNSMKNYGLVVLVPQVLLTYLFKKISIVIICSQLPAGTCRSAKNIRLWPVTCGDPWEPVPGPAGHNTGRYSHGSTCRYLSVTGTCEDPYHSANHPGSLLVSIEARDSGRALPDDFPNASLVRQHARNSVSSYTSWCCYLDTTQHLLYTLFHFAFIICVFWQFILITSTP